MRAETTPKAIVIGGSAGSLDALSKILPELRPDFPLPILIVVHLPPHKDSLLVEVTRNKCRLRVCEAQDKEPIEGGVVYFAPPDYHLLVESDGHLSLSFDAPHLFSRPSIDVLFESAADAYGDELIGIILSGANQDGARGLKAIVAVGGQAIVQSPDEAFASAMPLAAIESCPGAAVLPANRIAHFFGGRM